MKTYRPKKAKNKQFLRKYGKNPSYYSKNSGNEFKKLYNYQWYIFRSVFLKNNKHCYCCGRPSEVIDHVVPHKGNFELFWQSDNLMPLCKHCHDVITNKFDRMKNPKTDEKLKWIAEQRRKYNVSIRIKVINTRKFKEKSK